MKPFVVKKPWGSFLQFTHNEKTTVKILVVKPGEELSLQSHRKRSEFWFVVEGRPMVVLGKKVQTYKPGGMIKVGTRIKHQIKNKSKKLVRILEVAQGDFDENDIIRYEDKYCR